MRAILFVLAFSVFNPAFASGDYLLCGPVVINDFGCSQVEEAFLGGKCLIPIFDIWLSAPPEDGSRLNFLVGPSATELPVGELADSSVTYGEGGFGISYVVNPNEQIKQWQVVGASVQYIGGKNRKLYYEGTLTFVKFGEASDEQDEKFGCIRS